MEYKLAEVLYGTRIVTFVTDGDPYVTARSMGDYQWIRVSDAPEELAAQVASGAGEGGPLDLSGAQPATEPQDVGMPLRKIMTVEDYCRWRYGIPEDEEPTKSQLNCTNKLCRDGVLDAMKHGNRWLIKMPEKLVEWASGC